MTEPRETNLVDQWGSPRDDRSDESNLQFVQSLRNESLEAVDWAMGRTPHCNHDIRWACHIIGPAGSTGMERKYDSMERKYDSMEH